MRNQAGYNREVIDLSDDMRDKLRKHSGITIGHSNSESETFLPKIEFLGNMIFIDVAGLNDTSGPLMEFINRFILRSLFQKLEKVKFIVPITVENLK